MSGTCNFSRSYEKPVSENAVFGESQSSGYIQEVFFSTKGIICSFE